MLEKIIKEMYAKNIFSLLPNMDLENMLKNGYSDELFDSICSYIKNLDYSLRNKFAVSMSNVISVFCDKFTHELYELNMNYSLSKNSVIQKDMRVANKGGTALVGLDCNTSKFSLLERKLLKVIEHYFISISSKKVDDFKEFYIPIESLKMVFNNKNRFVIKQQIADTCKTLSTKKIYWDFSQTKYKKKLLAKKLISGNNEKIVDIDVVYMPKKNLSGINGESIEVTGIICKVSNFMKLRYEMKQIYNKFPIDSLKHNGLEFLVTEKLVYRINVLRANIKTNKAINTDFIISKKINDLCKELSLYENDLQMSKNYLSKLINGVNSKKTIIALIGAIMNATDNISNPDYSYKNVIIEDAYFSVNNHKISIYEHGALRSSLSVYEEIDDLIQSKKAVVKYYLESGTLELFYLATVLKSKK